MSEIKSITKLYYDFHNKYQEKFGSKALVLMQVGSFYEVYTDYTKTKGPNLEELEEITDVVHVRKNKSNDYSAYMWGFPMVATTKFIEILIDAGYHLIMVDQVTPPPKPQRKVTNIYSPAIYMNNEKLITNHKSNFVVNILIDEIQQPNKSTLNLIGMSACDISTGEVYVHETISKIDDEKLGLDEAIRFINGLNPKEVIITFENQIDISKDFIIEYLGLVNTQYRFTNINKEHMKITFQRKFFEKIYEKSNNMNSIFDSLELSSSNYARKSLITLLVYISDHFNNLIEGLLEPVFYINSKNMILGNNAINQLNIISSSETNGKYKNLLDVINKCKTNMGKRYTKLRLASPYTNVEKLNEIYSIVGKLQKKKYYEDLNKMLKSISDIERLERKIFLKNLHPCQINNFIHSYEKIIEIFESIKKSKLKSSLKTEIKEKSLRPKLKKLIKYLNKMINKERSQHYNLSDIKENIFNKGVYEDIDELEDEIINSQSLMTDIESYMNNLIKIKQNEKMITLENNKNDGYYYKITKKRFELLKSKLGNFTIHGKKYSLKDFNVKETTTYVKLSAKFLKNSTSEILLLREKITSKVHEKYIELLEKISQDYSSQLKLTTKIITELDYYCNIAYISKEYNYSKPIIQKKDSGFVVANKIRHPIVERIIDHEYVPHDVEIGNDIKGMLIYGLNSAGKSVLMKAIGISVIMAQSGFYVPAENFEYSPYQSLYTRITGNDNLFRGLSSFSLEMVELNSILKRTNENTLVIGDEVCRGTEHISGNALVASAILKLSKTNSSFVFATHLHEIMSLKEIKETENIKAFHLSVDIDPNSMDLVYDRILKEGSGERIYGILVAKNIIRDQDFIEKALEIKNILLDNDPNSSIISTKKSKYNSKIILDCCELCGKKNSYKNPTPLETHHINFQKDCENGFIKSKPYLKKNGTSNLVVLCQDCHDDLHNDEISIESIKMTNKGKKLIVKKK
jgi:DNA mismatch repair protein MutS